jgi:hypothetical protein
MPQKVTPAATHVDIGPGDSDSAVSAIRPHGRFHFASRPRMLIPQRSVTNPF